jgi:hypothetical protein
MSSHEAYTKGEEIMVKKIPIGSVVSVNVSEVVKHTSLHPERFLEKVAEEDLGVVVYSTLGGAGVCFWRNVGGVDGQRRQGWENKRLPEFG